MGNHDGHPGIADSFALIFGSVIMPPIPIIAIVVIGIPQRKVGTLIGDHGKREFFAQVLFHSDETGSNAGDLELCEVVIGAIVSRGVYISFPGFTVSSCLGAAACGHDYFIVFLKPDLRKWLGRPFDVGFCYAPGDGIAIV
jgi:hypothetical protein